MALYGGHMNDLVRLQVQLVNFQVQTLDHEDGRWKKLISIFLPVAPRVICAKSFWNTNSFEWTKCNLLHQNGPKLVSTQLRISHSLLSTGADSPLAVLFADSKQFFAPLHSTNGHWIRDLIKFWVFRIPMGFGLGKVHLKQGSKASASSTNSSLFVCW